MDRAADTGPCDNRSADRWCATADQCDSVLHDSAALRRDFYDQAAAPIAIIDNTDADREKDQSIPGSKLTLSNPRFASS